MNCLRIAGRPTHPATVDCKGPTAHHWGARRWEIEPQTHQREALRPLQALILLVVLPRRNRRARRRYCSRFTDTA